MIHLINVIFKSKLMQKFKKILMIKVEKSLS